MLFLLYKIIIWVDWNGLFRVLFCRSSSSKWLFSIFFRHGLHTYKNVEKWKIICVNHFNLCAMQNKLLISWLFIQDHTNSWVSRHQISAICCRISAVVWFNRTPRYLTKKLPVSFIFLRLLQGCRKVSNIGWAQA